MRIHVFFFLLFSAIGGVVYVAFDGDVMTKYLSFLCLFLAVWGVYSTKQKDNDSLTIYMFFFVGSSLFLLGYPVLYLFGLVDFGYDFIYRDTDVQYRNISILLVLSCVWALHLGALNENKYIRIHINNLTFDENEFKRKALVRVGFLLIVLALPGILSYYPKLFLMARAEGYFSLYDPDAQHYGVSSWANILAAFIMPASFMLIIGAKNNSFVRNIGVVNILIYVLLYVMIGRRAYAAMALTSMLILWDKEVKSVSRIGVYVLVIFSIFFVFPLIFLVRNLPAFSYNDIVHVFSVFPVEDLMLHSLVQMGKTLRTIYWSVEILDLSDVGYAFGQTYLWALTTAVPNLFWDVHPASLNTVALNIVKNVSYSFYSLGGGYGSSYVTEAFWNFGIISPFFCYILGRVIKLFSNTMNYNDPLMRYAVVTWFASAFILVRSESISVTRDFFWYSLLPLFFVLIVFKNQNMNVSLFVGSLKR